MNYRHTPVLLREVLEYLQPAANTNFIDCTFGGGGYSEEILNKIYPNGKVVAFDLDEKAIKHGKKKFIKKKNIILINDNFKNLSKHIRKVQSGSETRRFSGIVFDLGLSQDQLEDRSRGFSFMLDAPLNMAFGSSNVMADPKHENIRDIKNTTEYIVNKFKRENLEKIIREYGEERFAKQISISIERARKKEQITTTKQLVNIISIAVPGKYKNQKIHFATRTFQALRIATNKELENLQLALPQALDIIAKGGRIAVVSYHSLEDRIVKNYFKKESRNCICPPEAPICTCFHKSRIKIITKKVVVPDKNEILNNPKSRSAKLRVAEKI